METKTKEKFTTIYIPASLHKRLASLTLEKSLKTGKKIHIWEYIEEKIKDE
jgi:predicted DNA-binding protein